MDLFTEFFKDIVTAGQEFMKPKVYKGAILAFLILGGVASCTSCRNDNVVPPAPVPTVVPTVVPPLPSVQTVESKKASVVLPIVFQDQHPDTTPNSNYRLYANMAGKELVSLDSQPYTHSYEEFVLEAIRFVKDQGAVVQSSEKTFIDNRDMVVIESSREGIVAWFWVFTNDGVGYTFTCGGPETSGKPLHDLCFGLAQTITIK